MDQIWPAAGQLAPQVGHVRGHHRAGTAEVVVPHVVQQLRPGEHAAWIEHEVAQQPELGGRQLDEAAGPVDLVVVLVEFEVGEDQDRLLGFGAGTAQHGADPGRQLLQAERLGHVVVAADGEPGDLVGLGVLRGQEDHRDAVAVPAQPAYDVEPVEVGQHHVQDNQVERAVPGQPQRVGAVGGGGHVEAQEPQRGGHRVAQERLVVDHQQLPVVGRRVRCRVTHHVLLAIIPCLSDHLTAKAS
jgi:hypothetical protein